MHLIKYKRVHITQSNSWNLVPKHVGVWYLAWIAFYDLCSVLICQVPLLVDVLKIGSFLSYLTDKRRPDAVVSFYYTATTCLFAYFQSSNDKPPDTRCAAQRRHSGGRAHIGQAGGIYIYIYIHIHTPSCTMGTWVLFRGQSGRGVMLTTNPILRRR